MTEARVSIDVVESSGLRERLEAIPKGVQRALASTAVEVEDFIALRAGRHSKKGILERSIFKRQVGPETWEVGHDLQVASYARWVHNGARPHVILPRRRKALRWPAGARFQFAKKVNHPGNPPDRWMDDAARLAPIAFRRHAEAIIRSI